jgi:hypothetical protein
MNIHPELPAMVLQDSIIVAFICAEYGMSMQLLHPNFKIDEFGYDSWIPTGKPSKEPYVPALQRHGPEGDDGCEFAKQAKHADAPCVTENFPASQSVQPPVPVLSLNFPATHAVHDPSLGPVNPGLQTQLVKVVAPKILD